MSYMIKVSKNVIRKLNPHLHCYEIYCYTKKLIVEDCHRLLESLIFILINTKNKNIKRFYISIIVLDLKM